MKPELHSSQNWTKKKKIQANLFNELRCKNPQKHNGKLNLTAYQKDHTPQSSQFHTKDAEMVQHI
jgi:hypothetical protein